jgi:hypothetical protein
MRLGTVAQVILLDGAIAEVEEAQAEPEFAVDRALNHAVPLKNHEEAVRRAFMQLQ